MPQKSEFSGYAGRDGCDGPMEGGRGLKKIILRNSAFQLPLPE